MRIGASKFAFSSVLRKLDVKKLQSQRTAEEISAQLSGEIRRALSNLSDICGLQEYSTRRALEG